MPVLTPLGFLLIPLTIAAATRKQWALTFFFVSLPLYALRAGEAVGHSFSLPELAIIALGINQLHRWRTSREINLPLAIPVYALIGFWVTCLLSILYLALITPSIAVHPYNTGSLDELVLRDLAFTTNNITQFILRTFSVGAIVLLALNLERDDIKTAIKATVIGGIALLSVGVFYQITQYVDFYGFAQFLEWLGFRTQVRAGGFAGIPRMWTTAGEPGYGAHYLLFALTLTVPFALSSDESTPIFTRVGAWTFSAIFFIGLILSTSTTGYGGLVVFVFVLPVVALLSPSIDHERITVLYAYGFVGAVVVVLISMLLSAGVVTIIAYQIDKLQFNAGSGSLRLKYLQMAAEIVSSRPVLGVGVGSQYGSSLLGTLAAETGLLGLGMFLAAYLSSLFSCLKVAQRGKRESIISTAIMTASLTLLVTSLLAKSVTVLLFPWTWLSLALPIAVSLQYSSHQLFSVSDTEVSVESVSRS